MMDTLLQDLRYALRTLRRSPVFTFIAVLTLATAIGANTVIFTILNGVVLRPLQYEASDRLFGVWEENERGNYRLASYPAFRDWRAQSDVFEALAYIRGSSALMPGHNGARQVGAAFVSDEFFEVLRGPPLIGRLFSPDEQRPGGAPVAVLTHALWRDAFGGDRSAIGSTIRLNDAAYTVVGVLPDWFQFPSWAGVYLPLSTILPTDRILAQRGFHADSRIVAKLKPDVSIKQAQAAMAAIQSRLATAYPAENRGWTRVEFVSLFEEELRFGAVRPVLVLLAAAVAAVLLLACANVANMTLVRAARRSRELAIRAALGAGRGRVARLLLTEAILLVLAGGGLGLLLAWWATGVVRATAPAGLPRVSEIALDARMLGFTALISLLATVAIGVAPAVRPPMPDLSQPLKAGSPGTAGSGLWPRLRSSLVALEVALALVLLIATGLLVRSLWALSHVNPGFDPQGVVTFAVFPPPRYDAPERAVALYQHVAGAIAALPGVEAAGVVSALPLTGIAAATSFRAADRPEPPAGQAPVADIRAADNGYFLTLRIPLLRGRVFESTERAGAAVGVIVSQSLVRELWPGGDPIGKQLRVNWLQPGEVTIVGVVGDVRHRGLDVAPRQTIYFHVDQSPTNVVSIAVRGRAPAQRLAAEVRAVLRELDDRIPLRDPRTMEERIAASVGGRRYPMLLLGLFAAVALTLAAIGLYGVLSYTVGLRTREIGVRVALGAMPGMVLWMVVRRGLVLVGWGLALGIAVAAVATRVLRNLLYEVSPTDPVAFIAMAAVLAGAGLLASFVPARRAAQVDPMVALRTE